VNDNEKLSAYSIEILEVEKNDAVTYTFRCSRPDNLFWDTGANGHFSLELPTGIKDIDKEFQRHMSILSCGDEPYLEFTTRIRPSASNFKRKLSELRKGDSIFIYGINNRMPLVREDRNLIFITMGVALSTCRPYIREYEKDGRGILSLTCINIDKKGKSYFQKESVRFSAPRLTFSFSGDRDEFYRAIDNTLLLQKGIYYLIGSDPFLADTGRYLLQKGIDSKSIIIDKKYGIEEHLTKMAD